MAAPNTSPPRSWNVNRADVAPQYQGLWKDCGVAWCAGMGGPTPAYCQRGDYDLSDARAEQYESPYGEVSYRHYANNSNGLEMATLEDLSAFGSAQPGTGATGMTQSILVRPGLNSAGGGSDATWHDARILVGAFTALNLNYQVAMVVNASGQVALRYADSNAGFKTVTFTGHALADDSAWHLLTCVWRQADNDFRLYVDGVLEDSQAGDGGFGWAQWTLPLTEGYNWGGEQGASGQSVFGAFAALWTRQLGESELAVLHADPFGMFRHRRDRLTPPAIAVSGAGGQTVVIGLATEADSVLALDWAKVKEVGLNTEADSAFAMTADRATEIGLTTEADSALAAIWTRAREPGLVTETDSVLGLDWLKAKAIGLPTEADSALAITALQSTVVEIGLATETDSPLAPDWSKLKAIGLATEADAVFSLVIAKTGELGLATEADSAFAIAALQSTVVEIGLASEADSTLSLAWSKAKELGLATEDDSVFAITVSVQDGPPIPIAMYYYLQFLMR